MNVPTLEEVKSLYGDRPMSNLTQYEDTVLQTLKEASGEVVPHSRLHTILYGDKLPSANCLQVFIGRLRKKGYYIRAVRNVGYRYTGSASNAAKVITEAELKEEGLA